MSDIGKGTVAEMRAALQRLGRPVLGSTDAVATTCPLCATGVVCWTESERRWACDQQDCPSDGDSSRIAYELESEGVGGFAERVPRVPTVGTLPHDGVEPNSERVPLCHPLGGGTTGTPPKLRLLDIGRMLAEEPEPVPWIVEPLLARGCVTMLAGREGQGKSMLALALASAIGHGATVAGLECSAGRALVVDAENGEREAHRRVRGLQVKPDSLVYFEANQFNLATDIDMLAAMVDEHRPDVVVLDSLRSLAPGLDENDSKPAEAALRPVSRLAQEKDIPVLLLHHAGKAGLEYRGSTAIGAAVELGFTLSRHEDDPEKRTRRRLACWKSRPAPEPAARWLSLESHDGLVLLAEAEPYEGERGQRRQDAKEELLAALNGSFTSWPDWVRAAGMDPKNGTARRARESLLDEGLVIEAQGMYKRADGAS